MIDERSEWRTFADKDKEGGDPNRVGGPVNPLLGDAGLSTVIGGGKGVDRGLTNNLQRMQARTSTSDRSLLNAFGQISRVCSAMRLPDSVKHLAQEYYRDAKEKSKSVKSRTQSAVVAAVIFLACRQANVSRSFKEIRAFVPEALVKDISKMYKAIVADLKLKESGKFLSEVASIHPEHLLRRFMSSLGFNHSDMSRAIALSNAMLPQDNEADVHAAWHGRSPNTIAGTIIAIIASLESASKRPSFVDISNVSGVTEVTIRGLYREVKPLLQGLVASAGGFVSREEVAKLPEKLTLPTGVRTPA